MCSKLCPKGAVGNVYRTSRGYPQPCLQYSQLPDNIIPMLLKLGPHVSIDPVLMVKVIRISKGFIKEVPLIKLNLEALETIQVFFCFFFENCLVY